ncbi:hypothetical protein EV702DRAFT_1276882 [Suillus placidus]|uniref:Uncharacterized protein n=1 Tax=Suillus placidus TaxID=48579 RepID=A0A9P7D5K8_9AGAM|nr:hypothetical protein EV702DRAFT_1276882 [Suillus placidus]
MTQKPPFETNTGNFSLNVFGVAGFFGGDEAIAAMKTIHHHKARKFLGWYNSPGSWDVGKKFGQLAKSRFWDWLFPGPDEEHTRFFELDGKQGPTYVASRFGSILEHTGHLAYFIMQKSKGELGVEVQEEIITKRNKMTIIKTQKVFECAVGSVAKKETPKDKKGPHKRKEEEMLPNREIPPCSKFYTLAAVLPIAVSFTTCALCGWTYDCIGSTRLKLQGVKSASTAPPGDGMLMDGDNIVLLLGKKEDVATITRGRFILEYDPWVKWRSKKVIKKRSVLGSDRNSDVEKGQNNSSPKQVAAPQKQVASPTKQGAISPKSGDERVRNECPAFLKPGKESDGDEPLMPGQEPIIDEYNAIGFCSLLLGIQLLAQLLVIPQGTLFGQIMFLTSFAASWAYNLCLSLINNDDIQEQLILEELHLKEKHMRTYIFLTRTSAAVFACLMLQPVDSVTGKYVVADKWGDLGFKPEIIIHKLILDDMQEWDTWREKAWDTWREKVLGVMKTREGSKDTCDGLLRMSSEEEKTFGEDDRNLLKLLLEGARFAYNLAMKEKSWLEEN